MKRVVGRVAGSAGIVLTMASGVLAMHQSITPSAQVHASTTSCALYAYGTTGDGHTVNFVDLTTGAQQSVVVNIPGYLNSIVAYDNTHGYITQAEGGYALGEVRLDNGTYTKLADTSKYGKPYDLAIEPNGDKVLVSMRNNSNIVVWSRATSQMTLLTHSIPSPSAFIFPHNDGTAYTNGYYGSVLYHFSLTTGKILDQHKIPAGDSIVYEPSTNNIYISAPTQLWRVNMSTWKSSVVAGGFGDLDGIAIDSCGVVVAADWGNHSEANMGGVWKIPTRGGAPVMVTNRPMINGTAANKWDELMVSSFAPPTNTPTPTDTPTSMPTNTPTSTPTVADTATATDTPTDTPTGTPTPTGTVPTDTPTDTPTSTPSSTPQKGNTPPPSTNTPMATNTPVSTATNTPMPTSTVVPNNYTPVPTPTPISKVLPFTGNHIDPSMPAYGLILGLALIVLGALLRWKPEESF